MNSTDTNYSLPDNLPVFLFPFFLTFFFLFFPFLLPTQDISLSFELLAGNNYLPALQPRNPSVVHGTGTAPCLCLKTAQQLEQTHHQVKQGEVWEAAEGQTESTGPRPPHLEAKINPKSSTNSTAGLAVLASSFGLWWIPEEFCLFYLIFLPFFLVCIPFFLIFFNLYFCPNLFILFPSFLSLPI